MKRYVTLLLITFTGCHSPVSFPEGGYDYPVDVPASDTTFYHYPVRNQQSRRDSLYDATSFLFYRAFNEPNLSLAPGTQETFRFVCEGFKQDPVIITFTESGIVVKTSEMEIFESSDDTTRLDKMEKLHLRFLKKNYPLDGQRERYPAFQQYIDSMVGRYPELRSPAYYLELMYKGIQPHPAGFVYRSWKVPFSKKQYRDCVEAINASGYWTYPYSIPYTSQATDGTGYSLEANTRNKYNYVSACMNNDDSTRFVQLCHKLVKLAHMENRVAL